MRAILSTALLLFFSLGSFANPVQDVSRLASEEISKLFKVTSEADILSALEYARAHDQQVVIAGTRHSQGGHILYPDAVMLDMTAYNQVINVDPTDKTVRVQAGATWAQVQQAVNPHRLAVAVMQSSNIFSVGGTLSANAHGRHTQLGPIIDTVVDIKVALASGKIVSASPQQNARLFYAIIGGYGALGVILEAKLQLVDNLMLEKTVTAVDYQSYIAHLKDSADTLALHYGRCSIARNQDFLEECFSIDYVPTDAPASNAALQEEQHITRNAILFDLSRSSPYGKALRWQLQQSLMDRTDRTVTLSRNNAMRPPIHFLDYYSETDTDILQEYFVPLDQFPAFMHAMKAILLEHQVNLLSVTLRYLKQNNDNLLPYAQHDSIAIVLYINMGLEPAAIEHAQKWTRALVDSAQAHNGSYYLAYQRFPSLAQFQRSYPGWTEFAQVKQQYDPTGLFNNLFYAHYIGQPWAAESTRDSNTARRAP